jgi:hypothetical protein
MMPNGRSKILKLASGRASRPSLLNVLFARLLVDFGQGLFTQMIKDVIEAPGRFPRPCMFVCNVLGIDRDYVRDFDGSWVTLADPGGPVLSGDKVAQRSFSTCNFALAAPSASLKLAISDAPNCLLDDLPVLVPPRRL